MKYLIGCILTFHVLVAYAQGESEAVYRQQIEHQVKNCLRSYLDAFCHRIELTAINRQKISLPLLAEGVNFTTRLPHYSAPLSQMGVWIDAWKAERHIASWFVNYKVECLSPVWITTGEVKRGETLNSTHIERRMVNIIDLKFKPLQSIDALIARKNLAKGTVLTKQHIRYPSAVNKGEQVQLTVYSGNVRLELRAIALSEGAIADHIWVKPLGMKKAVEAEIIDKSWVVIE